MTTNPQAQELPELSHTDTTNILWYVIPWLEAGCDPKAAAQELRLLAGRIAASQAAQGVDQRIRDVGYKMSNVLFNLSQQEGAELTAFVCSSMKKLQVEWDAAIHEIPNPPPVEMREAISEEQIREIGASCHEYLEKNGGEWGIVFARRIEAFRGIGTDKKGE